MADTLSSFSLSYTQIWPRAVPLYQRKWHAAQNIQTDPARNPPVVAEFATRMPFPLVRWARLALAL